MSASIEREDCDVGGIGGTLAGSALSLAAIRATLTEVLTDEAFGRIDPPGRAVRSRGERSAPRLRRPVARDPPRGTGRVPLPAEPPRTGTALHDAMDPELERFLHLWAMNRGVLMTPFRQHGSDVPRDDRGRRDRHTEVFGEAIEALFGA